MEKADGLNVANVQSQDGSVEKQIFGDLRTRIVTKLNISDTESNRAKIDNLAMEALILLKNTPLGERLGLRKEIPSPTISEDKTTDETECSPQTISEEDKTKLIDIFATRVVDAQKTPETAPAQQAAKTDEQTAIEKCRITLRENPELFAESLNKPDSVKKEDLIRLLKEESLNSIDAAGEARIDALIGKSKLIRSINDKDLRFALVSYLVIRNPNLVIVRINSYNLSPFQRLDLTQDIQENPKYIEKQFQKINTSVTSPTEPINSGQFLSLNELLQRRSFTDLTGVTGNTLQRIGGGTWGTTYRIDKIYIDSMAYSTKIALKLPTLVPGAIEEIKSEIAFIDTLHGKLTDEEKQVMFPNVHKITYNGQEGYLTELYDGNLDSYLKNNKLNNNQKKEIATQLLEQMAILSKYGAIYTDIKPANILIKDGPPLKAVLSDFGNCHFIDSKNTIPDYGFTSSPSFVCDKDKDLFNWVEMKEKDEATLKEKTDQHEARALGLLLCSLFGGIPDIFNDTYTMQDLKHFYSTNKCLDTVRNDKALDNTISGLLGLTKGFLGFTKRQMKPVEASEYWRNNRS